MDVISFKIPEKDKDFLDWYSERTATPVGSLYRSITLDPFHRWKLQKLVELYSSGEVSFKEMCDRGDISLSRGMLLLEEMDVEPPIPELVDNYTIDLTLKHIEEKDTSIFKDEESIKRR